MRLLSSSIVRYAPSIIAWLVTAAYLAVSYTYRPAPRAMPLLIGWPVLVLLSLDIVAMTPSRTGRALTAWLNPAREEDTRNTYASSRQLCALGAVAAFTLGLIFVGILPGVALFVFAMMRFFGRKSYRLSLIVAVLVTLFVFVVMGLLLRIDLYPGLLIERLAQYVAPNDLQ